MTGHQEHKCWRCGTSLKIETVKVPVYLDHLSMKDGEIVKTRVLAHYKDREEVSDCPRCMGAY